MSDRCDGAACAAIGTPRTGGDHSRVASFRRLVWIDKRSAARLDATMLHMSLHHGTIDMGSPVLIDAGAPARASSLPPSGG